MSEINGYPSPGDGLVNNPDLNSRLQPRVRAIKDDGQARRVATSLIHADRERQIINGRIVAKLNAEKPQRQALLEAEGLGWKSNFTTKPLSQMAEKAGPRLVQAIDGQKYLTNSALPAHIDGATRKTEIFRREVTDTIRARKGWSTLLEDIALETTLFGYTAVGWLDKWTWFPKHFRQDELFLPRGTKQCADTAQLVMLKESYLPHELFAQIEDRDEAEAAGWDVAATVDQINKAVPELGLVKTTGQERLYEDTKRELNAAFSFDDGNRTIVVYALLAREVTGKVSMRRLAGPELTQIFQDDDIFDSMTEALSFFAYQKGNGTMHGSKGIGREVYELAGIIDRSRNEIVDRLMLSGKILIQTDDKNVKRFRMSVVGNSILIGRAFTVLEQKIDGNVQPFLQLDAYLGLIVDQLIGSVSPRQLQGERVTAAQVNLFAEREEEAKDSKITRFLRHCVEMVGTIQKRLLDPETVEDDAKDLQKRLLDAGLTREELDMLRKAPVAGTITDLTSTQRQQIVLLAQENRGNPLYNQRQLEYEKVVAQVDDEFAEKVLLPDEDPTVAAEQTRLQQMELTLLSSGQSVPVSPRDNHEIHLAILDPVFEGLAQAIHGGQATTDTLEVLWQHAQSHYDMALQSGVPAAKLAPVKDKLGKVQKMIAELKQLDAQAASVQEAGGALQSASEQEDAMAANSLAISAQLDQ